MLTVWTMCTGDAFAPDEVRILKRQVNRYVSIPHEFVCITEHDIEGVDTVKPINDLPGWWGKVNLFSPEVSRARNLWLDLDVTITRSLSPLYSMPLTTSLKATCNWAESGHGGVQSSVMYWEGQSARVIHDEFDPAIAHWPPRNEPGVLWGDQEFITVMRDTGRLQVEYFDPAHIVSYKYHCREGLPEDSLVQVFHGKPDPGDVNDEWVKQCRR